MLLRIDTICVCVCLQELLQLQAILNNSPATNANILGPSILTRLIAIKVAYFSETVERVPTTVTPGRKGFFPFLRVEEELESESGSTTFTTAFCQLRAVFHAVYTNDEEEKDIKQLFLVRFVNMLYFSVVNFSVVHCLPLLCCSFSILTSPRDRWAEVLPESEWDATGDTLLKWEIAPEDKQLRGQGNAFFQIIEVGSILGTVTVIPKPGLPGCDNVYHDNCDINHEDRRMWVHEVGKSSLGET